jgi:flagellar basal-body rod protein FlgB
MEIKHQKIAAEKSQILTNPSKKVLQMTINFKDALGIHAEVLGLRAERTKVLAANIANESTPGFTARDVDFGAMLQERIDGADGALGLGDGEALYRVPFHPSADGNTVEIGVEQAAFSQNASDFQTSLTFVNMQLRGLAKAINGQ